MKDNLSAFSDAMGDDFDRLIGMLGDEEDDEEDCAYERGEKQMDGLCLVCQAAQDKRIPPPSRILIDGIRVYLEIKMKRNAMFTVALDQILAAMSVMYQMTRLSIEKGHENEIS